MRPKRDTQFRIDRFRGCNVELLLRDDIWMASQGQNAEKVIRFLRLADIDRISGTRAPNQFGDACLR